MDDQNRNLILATALSMLVILVWFLLFPPPEQPTDAAQTEPAEQVDAVADEPLSVMEDPGETSPASPTTDVPLEQAVEAVRITIETPRITGSISTQGGRIDDVSLKDYRETLDADSEIVTVLSPEGEETPYYAVYGWWARSSGLDADQVPTANTIWSVDEDATLTPESPITLTWDNGAGLVFSRTISVDEDFMFSITQSVENNTGDAVSLAPYGFIVRQGLPQLRNYRFILHEGAVGMRDGILIEREAQYHDMEGFEPNPDLGNRQGTRYAGVSNGWIGFTDQYWMTSLIPEAENGFDLDIIYENGSYFTRIIEPTKEIAPGETAQTRSRFFAGAKEWETVRYYEREEGVDRFLDSTDWGWFFFLTKPIFAMLHWLNAVIGNMGWSIILLTFVIKAALLPLAFKSYVSMAKMRELQPEMEKLKERAGDDREALQKGMMELYRTNKVNPASGCLPILLQIPIFFSLYKVIFVTIELRHAPWIGWIRDLSAPDPSSLYNLWGILPWAGPEPGSILALIFIGLMPLALGISMWLQQKLNPAPTDPTQQMVFAWLPWIFMFMLGSFASGLVLYWITNNTITFGQQYLIMRSQGFKPDILGNIRGAKKPSGETSGDKK